LRYISENVYAPISRQLEERGLPALEEHWHNVFTAERGEFRTRYEDDTLVLEVSKCPAISHMQEKNHPIFEKFCEVTRLVNEGICHRADYDCSVEYDQTKGRCVQKFWKCDSQ